jgi:hypothetical protein
MPQARCCIPGLSALSRGHGPLERNVEIIRSSLSIEPVAGFPRAIRIVPIVKGSQSLLSSDLGPARPKATTKYRRLVEAARFQLSTISFRTNVVDSIILRSETSSQNAKKSRQSGLATIGMQGLGRKSAVCPLINAPHQIREFEKSQRLRAVA